VRGLAILAGLLVMPISALASGQAEEADHGMVFVWEWANLLILVAVLFLLTRKPVLAYLGDRRSRIQENLDNAEQLLRDSESRLQEWNARVEGLDAEVADIRRLAQAAAVQERERILADARAIAERIERDAGSAVERETRRARLALREEASQLAVELAANLLREKVTAEDRDRLVDEFVARLEREGAGSGAGGTA
jgi:F-type H+-transporting ATPase subunit b